MTAHASTFCLSVLLMPWIMLTAQPALGESRVALVIGNGSYKTVPGLANPTRDSADIARALERLNFKVSQISDATAQGMRKAVIDFGRSAEGSDMAVVFYAGHGMEVGGENWLIPIDAELRSDADTESEAISLRAINAQVSKARQLGLIILDACRNNPFAAKMKRSVSSRALSRGLAPTEPMENVLVAYAARDGTTASDGDGKNSPFTTALLQHIETPGLEISFLFRRVRDDVMAATKREQQPFVYGSLSREEIYLKAPSASSTGSSTSRPVVMNLTEDENFWQAIQTSSVTGLYEEFLARYPRSSRAAEARQRMKELKVKEVAAVSPMTTSQKPERSEDQISDKKASDRNLFTNNDRQRVAAIAATQKLDMPTYDIAPVSDGPLTVNAKFVGVWSSKRGWGDGTGRYGMLIVTGVSDTGSASGYYVWGPPGKRSWSKDGAGYKWFSNYIVNDKFSIGGTEVSAKLDNKSVMTLSSFRKDKPSETSSIELHPVWQLVRAPFDTEPSARLVQPSRRKPVKQDASADPRPARTVSGSTVEERYRACRKLVKGFARREACARTGAI